MLNETPPFNPGLVDLDDMNDEQLLASLPLTDEEKATSGADDATLVRRLATEAMKSDPELSLSDALYRAADARLAAKVSLGKFDTAVVDSTNGMVMGVTRAEDATQAVQQAIEDVGR